MSKKPFPFKVCEQCCAEPGSGGGGEGGNIVIDAAMSDTSENAVQNKVIKAYVDESILHINERINEAILESWEVAV